MQQELQVRSGAGCFGGRVEFYRHPSRVCQCEMNFSVFVPPIAAKQPVPVLYFLSGLTCTDENFMTKAGAQRVAAELGLLLVAPDTSPRGEGVIDEPDDWSLGVGAGFYVDATESPWRSNYQMYSYVTQELPALIQSNFPVLMDLDGPRQSIMGHSMGGHGALISALKNPSQYRSVSAFAPIAAPMYSAWGQKAFQHYLGDNESQWANYDASKLVQRSPLPYPIWIDQGLDDSFLAAQLQLEVFESACAESRQALRVERRSGYDHGYYFIASFIEEHLRFHAQFLVGA